MKVGDSLGRRCREGVELCREGVGIGTAFFFWLRLRGGGEEGRSISKKEYVLDTSFHGEISSLLYVMEREYRLVRLPGHGYMAAASGRLGLLSHTIEFHKNISVYVHS